MKQKIKTIAGNVLFYAALAFVLFCAVFLLVRGRGGEPTYFFGHSFLWVETASMQPTIEEKSYIMVKKAGDTALSPGDVIVFTCKDSTSPVYGSLITHRIVEETENGYHTKGDNPMSAIDPWTVAREDVVAVYEKNVPVLTFLGRVFATKTGFFLLLGVFVAICGLVYLPSMVKSAREESEKTAAAEKEKEIARRVAAEVERLEREERGKHGAPGKNQNKKD